MLKLQLLLLVLLTPCIAQEPVPPVAQLQGTARVLLVFAPSTNTAAFRQQLQLIERHSFELTRWNTVVVPVSTAKSSDDPFSFENLPLGTAGEQAGARTRFHVMPGDFLVVLLNENGVEQMRSAIPIDIHVLVARLDPPPMH